MLVKKHILPIVYGILILLFFFEGPSLLVFNELNEKSYEEKEVEEELNEANHFEEGYLEILSSGGCAAFVFTTSVFSKAKIHTYPQECKNNFKAQSFKIAFLPPLYILFCSLKLD